MNPKTKFAFFLIGFLVPITVLSQTSTSSTFGTLVMAGARYDDVRKCVASSVGTKGGPIADIMLTYQLPISENKAFRFNLPVMRPLLFALAFNSLQFEPEANLLIQLNTKRSKKLIIAPGLGLSLNYINEYDNPNDDPRYFSWGPIFSVQTGFALTTNATQTLSVRAFYSPLFSSGDGRNGTVAGLTLLYWRHL